MDLAGLRAPPSVLRTAQLHIQCDLLSWHNVQRVRRAARAMQHGSREAPEARTAPPKMASRRPALALHGRGPWTPSNVQPAVDMHATSSPPCVEYRLQIGFSWRADAFGSSSFRPRVGRHAADCHVFSFFIFLTGDENWSEMYQHCAAEWVSHSASGYTV